MKKAELVKEALGRGNGIIKLSPCWVPRAFLVPGRRLKLAPKDLYALGSHRGGIDERWLASTTNADNGPGTPGDEGLSYIVFENGGSVKKILLKEAISLRGDLFLGRKVMGKHGGWMVLTKFFDNMGPIPFHVHQTDRQAKKVGRIGKPEAYYFPAQLNLIENNFPFAFLGLEPGTTKQDVIRCLERWEQGDNGILDLSKAYRLRPGTGWGLPAGILHAPGSLVTYETQRASDVSGLFQSMVEGRYISRDLLVKDVPQDKHNDLRYIAGMLDWEANIDPNFKKNHYLEPRPAEGIVDEMKEKGYNEKRIIYGSDKFSAKELTVFPGRTAEIRDSAAYGAVVIQGRGKIGRLDAETPAIIRYGELTNDEFFVTAEAAKTGIKITNTGGQEDLVMLKHFGPE